MDIISNADWFENSKSKACLLPLLKFRRHTRICGLTICIWKPFENVSMGEKLSWNEENIWLVFFSLKENEREKGLPSSIVNSKSIGNQKSGKNTQKENKSFCRRQFRKMCHHCYSTGTAIDNTDNAQLKIILNKNAGKIIKLKKHYPLDHSSLLQRKNYLP